MDLSIVKVKRNEYSSGNLAVRDYIVTFLGFPIYSARYTSTNIQAIHQLGEIKTKQLHVCGFTYN